MSTDRLSLPAAIFINVNIMLGVGIFANTVVLSQRAGAFGCFSYAIVALLLLPLIMSIARLIALYPDAGFYGYGANAIHPFAGFIGAWCYFTGKIASATFMLHVGISMLQQVLPAMQTIPTILLDAIVLILFVFLNLLNIKTGSKIQGWLLVLKMVPIWFVVLCGIFIIKGTNLSLANVHFEGILSTIPIVLYAAAGFEATCSLSCRIENARRNGPLAIFISYGFVMLIAFLYQFFFYGAVGSALANQSSYLAAFPLFLQSLFASHSAIMPIAQAVIYAAITASALGAAYGIIYSNYWNLYMLASAGHTFFKKSLTKLSKYQVPYLCLLAEGLIGLMYIGLLQGAQLPLVQTSVLGGSIAYTMSVISLLWIVIKGKLGLKQLWIPLFALFNCILFVVTTINNFRISGLYPFYLFLFFVSCGIGMYAYTEMRKQKQFSEQQ